VTYAYSGTSNSDLELVGDPLSDSEAEALFGPNYTPTGNYDHIGDVLFDIMNSASENIMTTLSDAERASLADAVENTLTGTSSPEEPSQTHSRTWGEFFWDAGWGGLQIVGGVAEISLGSTVAVGGSAGSSGLGAVPAIAFGSGLVLKGSDDAYAGLRQIVGERDAVPYWEQGVTYIVGEELAAPAAVVIDTITGKPANLLKNAAEDVPLGAVQRSSKGAKKTLPGLRQISMILDFSLDVRHLPKKSKAQSGVKFTR